MAASAATLAGHRATSATIQIPEWGCWYADASVDGEHALSGRVDLVIADLTLKGTVIAGGVSKGRAHYRIVAGAAGWGKQLPSKAYANDAGVKVSTVLGDVASAAGETLDASTVSTSNRVGPSYVRPEGPAVRVLEQQAPRGWYVGEDGVTRLGKRAAKTLPAGVTHGPVDLARRTVTLAGESIASIRPGLVVDGLTAVDVQHEISATGGLRSTVWGRSFSSSSRRLATLQALQEQLDPARRFRGITEYRVVTRDGKRLNLQPVRVSTGMPDLARVYVRPGVSGCEAEVALGSRVLVAFVDSDPARPVVTSFEDAEGEGFEPTTVTISKGVLGVARMTDPVQAGPFAGTITMGSTKVKAG